jgi:hypothetical protein
LAFFWLVFSLCFFIHEIRASRGRCYGFPRNLALVSVLYVTERPEMTPQNEKSKMATTTKTKSTKETKNET